MKPIAEVIKYEGDNSTFIWKHPVEDFNTGTQLIVHESQEAVFFMNGQALDLFGPGRHLLETQNIPLIGKFFRRPTNDVTPFHCEVYYINKTEQMAVKWGTDSKVEFLEPRYKFPIKIGASGEMSLRIEDSRKLLVKVVGTEHGITQPELVQKLRAFLMTRIKSYLVATIRDQGLQIFEIDAQLTDMSKSLHTLLYPDFIDYGVSLEKFFVTTIVKPEEDTSYQKFKELYFRQYADVAEAELNQRVGVIDEQTKAQRTVIESQGIAQKRAIEGYTYRDERGFDVAEKIAMNEATGNFTNIGTGLGMMMGVGGTIGSTVGGVVNETLGGFKESQNKPNPEGMTCVGCGAKIPPNSKFCPECGATQKRICSNCGATLAPSVKFCPECGNKV